MCKGITSANFQLSGYVGVIKEQFIISVGGSIIISRISLRYCKLTLFGPEALLDGDLKIILRTSSRVTKLNLNLSASATCVDLLVMGIYCFDLLLLLLTLSALIFPTDMKKLLMQMYLIDSMKQSDCRCT